MLPEAFTPLERGRFERGVRGDQSPREPKDRREETGTRKQGGGREGRKKTQLRERRVGEVPGSGVEDRGPQLVWPPPPPPVSGRAAGTLL